MDFKKYQHIERFGTTEVEGIEHGICHIFPKIDGSNASLWLGDDLEVRAGSRNRELSLDNDNAGFMKWAINQDNIIMLLQQNPELRLFGEWLVPHSLKTYREEAWGNFYVFDVMEDDDYLHYDDYKNILESYGIEYIPPICMIKDPLFEKLVKILQENDYLIRDGAGIGEGIVIKNYNYKNRFGRQIWAKIVTSEFKEKHRKAMGPVEKVEKQLVEKLIADEFITSSVVDKVHANLVNDLGGWCSKTIPRFLNTVYYDLIKEESWEFLKKHNYPTVNYKTLKHFVFAKVKDIKPELFN